MKRFAAPIMLIFLDMKSS